MISRDELEKYLDKIYSVDDFEDYCINGLVVEGRAKIEKIGFGVSFNLPFLNKAVENECDAIVVHHGIFENGFFSLKGYLRERVKRLIENDISLFSIHLPMDAHPQIGHNALMFNVIGAQITGKINVGFIGVNSGGRSILEISDKLNDYLIPQGIKSAKESISNDDYFSLNKRGCFTLLKNGPDVPKMVAIVSGGSSGIYEEAVNLGADTFICGDIREHIPAISFETKTNFLNIGHYFSERPGILALKEKIDKEFSVECVFIEIPNPV
jgi:dinuclear metal center YbgI/SA1388 family protein